MNWIEVDLAVDQAVAEFREAAGCDPSVLYMDLESAEKLGLRKPLTLVKALDGAGIFYKGMEVRTTEADMPYCTE
jgi:hypothetical protein